MARVIRDQPSRIPGRHRGWRVPPRIAEAVHHWDLVMRETEWRDLMGAPPPWPDDLSIKPLAEPLKAWPADVARIGLMHRFGRLLPAMSKLAAG